MPQHPGSVSVIGYGIRESLERAAQRRRLPTVMCPSKPVVLSIDSNVWRVLEHLTVDDPYVTSNTWAFCELWYDLELLLDYCTRHSLGPRDGCLLAVGAEPATLRALAEAQCPTPTARPERLDAGRIQWTFAGHDVTDPDFYSHLTSVGSLVDHGGAAPGHDRLLNDYHLCPTIADAAFLIDIATRSGFAEGHLPALAFDVFIAPVW